MMKNHLFPLLASWLMWAINSTIRLRVIGEEKIKELNEQNKRIVYIVWHGQQFLLAFYMRQRGIGVLTSLSQDGEYLARVLSKFGYRVLRGSDSRGGAKGLLGLLRQLRQGYDVVFAADGPRGPGHEVKEGAVYLAKKMKAYIVPLTCGVKKGRVFTKAWDKFLLPYPFTKGVIIFGQPYLPSENLEIPEECRRLKEEMDRLTEKANKMARQGGVDEF